MRSTSAETRYHAAGGRHSRWWLRPAAISHERTTPRLPSSGERSVVPSTPSFLHGVQPLRIPRRFTHDTTDLWGYSAASQTAIASRPLRLLSGTVGPAKGVGCKRARCGGSTYARSPWRSPLVSSSFPECPRRVGRKRRQHPLAGRREWLQGQRLPRRLTSARRRQLAHVRLLSTLRKHLLRARTSPR